MLHKCNASLVGTRGKRIVIDCSKCSGGGSLDSPACMRTALEYLKKNTVDELKFVKKDFSELYDKKEVALLAELVDVVRRFEEGRVWDELKCELKEDDERYKEFIKNNISEFYSNPVKAYHMLEGIIKQYNLELEHLYEVIEKRKHGSHRDKMHRAALESYIPLLERLRDAVDKTGYIKALKEGKLKALMRPIVQPAFVPSHIDLKLPEKTELTDFYQVAGCDIRIYDRDGEKIYFLNPPEVWLYPEQVDLVVKLNHFISKQHSLDIFDPKEAREYFKRIALENLPKFAPKASREELERLSEIFARYSAGYGLLEILFRDKHIMDIYVDSPPGATPVYINHDKYGSCTTNLYLTPEDLERLSSKFRAISERPFDEANPILDMDLRDVSVRVAGLCEPSTFDGLAYAFRKHRENPWTLAKFVQMKMLSPKSAALLSFLVSGHCAMLITGARGAGKTSLLSALIAEVDPRDRIILMEDTAEIPAKSLRDKGWKIEHMKNQAVIAQKKGYELSPEDNLRAALRLGESVLVLGEVRGAEARVLFEAMRVGAAGNSVLGTIHGSNPYDTWDRITNDLNVPATSFKAVDIIVSLRYRETGRDGVKSRQVMQITEIRKKWDVNPDKEGAFFDLMKVDDYSGKEAFNLTDSEVVNHICKRKGLTPSEFEELFESQARMIEDLVKNAEYFDYLLEIEYVKEANKKRRLIYTKKGVKGIYAEWKHWFNGYIEELKNKVAHNPPKH